jgi:hypothetical protein
MFFRSGKYRGFAGIIGVTGVGAILVAGARRNKRLAFPPARKQNLIAGHRANGRAHGTQ